MTTAHETERDDSRMRADIRDMVRILGDVIRDEWGEDFFTLVEEVRNTTRTLRESPDPQRLQALIDDFALFGIVAGQYAFDSLLADEEFDLGGVRFGRGYDLGEVSGDNGVGFTGELQYTRQPGLEYMNRYQVFAFYDVGKVWQRDAGGNESLASAGGGVRLWPTPWLSLEFLAAKPLTLGTQRADGERDPQILFRAYGQF